MVEPIAPPLANRAFSLVGEGRAAALMVHGLGGGPYEVQRLGEALAARGLGAEGMVLPGHEAGPTRMPRSTWPEWHEAVERRYAELAARFDVVHLVGFSTGATVALSLAEERTLRGRLVLLAPFVRVFRPPLVPLAPELLVERLGFVTAVPRRRPPLRDRQTRLAVERCATFRTFNLDATRSALALVARALEGAARVTTPTLVVQGANDSVVDPEGARELLERLPEPKRLAWIPDSDHLLTLDAARADVEREVATFLGA